MPSYWISKTTISFIFCHHFSKLLRDFVFYLLKKKSFLSGKNNVCVHPASILREDYDVVHHPGYLTIHYTSTKSVPGLHLVWVPNTSLHKSTGVQHSRRSQSLNRLVSGSHSPYICSMNNLEQNCMTLKVLTVRSTGDYIKI